MEIPEAALEFKGLQQPRKRDHFICALNTGVVPSLVHHCCKVWPRVIIAYAKCNPRLKTP